MYVFVLEKGKLSLNYPCYPFLSGALHKSHQKQRLYKNAFAHVFSLAVTVVTSVWSVEVIGDNFPYYTF